MKQLWAIFIVLFIISFSGCAVKNPGGAVIKDLPLEKKGMSLPDNVPDQANGRGKYYELIQIVNCPSDEAQYGDYQDWGYWTGNRWCDQDVKPGYWVWVPPNWYIWNKQR